MILRMPTVEQMQAVQTNSIYVHYFNNFRDRVVSKFGYRNYPKGMNPIKHENYLFNKTTDAVLRHLGGPCPDEAYSLPYISNSGYRDMYGQPSGLIFGLTENTEHDRIPSKDYVIFYDTTACENDIGSSFNAVCMFAYWAYEVHNVFRSNLMHQNKPFILPTTPQTKLSTNNIWQQFSSFVPYINLFLKKGQKPADLKDQFQTIDLRVDFHGKELAEILSMIVNMVDGRIDMNTMAGRDRVSSYDFATQCNQAIIDNMSRYLIRKQKVEECNERGFHGPDGKMEVFINGYDFQEVRPFNDEYFENKTFEDAGGEELLK